MTLKGLKINDEEIEILKNSKVHPVPSTIPASYWTADDEYLALASSILDYGRVKGDRTGTGTISMFGAHLRFDLKSGFPLLTTKTIHWKSVVHELLWFISGDTNIKYLNDNGVRIWDEWVNENGDLGPVYGKQWRKWDTGRTKTVGMQHEWGKGIVPITEPVVIDQLKEVIHQIKTNPDSRRLVITAWNPADIPDMALPPCHYAFQFYVEPLREGETKRRLSSMVHMRSSDLFLGLPFNIASYALLTHLVAHVCDLDVGEFIWTGGDCHIYLNHIEQVKEQLTREPYPSPKIKLNSEIKNIDEFKFEDIELVDYKAHPRIKAEVSV
jgi:thymidylate synthase